MKQPLFIIFTLALIVLVVGITYIWIKDNEEPQISGIKTGQAEIDISSIQALQQQVDQGHQPWRLDPLLVAQAEASEYGFMQEDIQTLQLPPYSQADLGVSITTLRGEIMHREKMYLVTLVQPVPGQGKIWTIIEVEHLNIILRFQP